MRSITIPPAGETREFDTIKKGLSLFVVQAPQVQRIEQAASFSFEDQGVDWPAITGTKAPFGNCTFSSIKVTGTAETAGSELIVVSVPTCVDPDVSVSPNFKKSIAGATFTKAASDAAQSFSDIELQDSNGNLPVRLYVYVVGGATRGINYAYDTNPSQADPANDSYYWDNDRTHESAGDLVTIEPLEIVGIDWIQKFSFIAAIAGETPNLIVTPEY